VKSRYSASANGHQIMENIQDELQRKEENLSEKRRELQDVQYAECTFNPETTKLYEEPEQVVVVSGLGRFFELRDLAKRKQLEQEKREASVFHPTSNVRCDGITIPEPFSLSRGVKSDLGHGGAMLCDRECTFAPQTNESENRKLLQRIMSSEDAIP